MRHAFPQVVQHTDGPECFHCGQMLASVPSIDAGYPDRHGRFKKRCPLCGFYTYYDLKGEIDANDPARG
jgi:hypothetical protein